MSQLCIFLLILTCVFPVVFCNSTTVGNASADAITCSDGLVISCWRPFQVSLTVKALRGLVYFASLLYLFMGVSIISDRFMAAIEVITSQEREVMVKKRIVVARVWNETVANLTLMALGSSAPEILLSVIEIWAKDFSAGELGPGTIVGSAAYNLFVIIALCVSVIPEGETRRIKHLNVFFVTATWSVFAYVWLYLILAVFSPGVVLLWEGLVTFFFFPLTVITAYCADKHLIKLARKRFRVNKRGVIVRGSGERRNIRVGGSLEEGGRNGGIMSPKREGIDGIEDGNKTEEPKAIASPRQFKTRNNVIILRGEDAPLESPTGRFFVNKHGLVVSRPLEEEPHESDAVNSACREEYINLLRDLRQQHPTLDLVSLEKMAQEVLLSKGKKSRAFYRIVATRRLMGSADLLKRASEPSSKSQPELNEDRKDGERSPVATRVAFDPAHYTVLESCGSFEVRVVRTGDTAASLSVAYQTEDGSAVAGSDYVPKEGKLHFAPNETEKFIKIEVVDDDVFEQDEHFFVRLSAVGTLPPATIVSPAPATVVILDDDHSGVFRFKQRDLEVTEAVGVAELKVERCSGARGRIKLPFRTQDGTAKAGKDYEEVKGEVIFQDNESEKIISITVLEEDSYEKDVLFYVHLDEPEVDDETLLSQITLAERKPPHLRTAEERLLLLGRPRLGDVITAQVRVKESKEFKNMVDKLVQRANASLLVGTSSWREQFSEALTPEGEDKLQLALHYLTLPWKLVFAIVPPTSICNGYICFVVSILCIGVVTAIIGDVASHFGATLGIRDSVTAIVFVALGTSIPDTFASKVAAIQDDYADASVGNVTGSNAVNVFLGIGIAWTVAALVKSSRGEAFLVDPGSLAYSVTIFCCGAVLTIVTMLIRRCTPSIGAELGGPVCIKYITSTFLFSLWLLYLILSTLEVYHVIPGF